MTVKLMGDAFYRFILWAVIEQRGGVWERVGTEWEIEEMESGHDYKGNFQSRVR